jgi:hypothetical protein
MLAAFSQAVGCEARLVRDCFVAVFRKRLADQCLPYTHGTGWSLFGARVKQAVPACWRIFRLDSPGGALES